MLKFLLGGSGQNITLLPPSMLPQEVLHFQDVFFLEVYFSTRRFTLEILVHQYFFDPVTQQLDGRNAPHDALQLPCLHRPIANQKLRSQPLHVGIPQDQFLPNSLVKLWEKG